MHLKENIINKIKNTKVNLSIIALLIVSILIFLLHLFTSLRGIYGYYIDEFYYIACSKKLAFGYVDHPPLSILILKIWGTIFGYSIFSIRFTTALTASVIVFLTGLTVKKLEGKLFSIILGALLVAATPVFLSMTSFFSMNSFEILIWTLCSYILIIIVKENKPKLWIIFGIVAGLGLQNKHTIIIYGLGIVLGLLLTKERKQFLNIWLWIGGLIALIIFIPNILWEIKNNFPTLEFYRNASYGKYIHNPPHVVLLSLIMSYNPTVFIFWIAGIVYLFFTKKYKFFGWAFCILIAYLIITKSSRPDRIMGIFPVIFAFSSILIENTIDKKNINWLKPVTTTYVLISIILISPMVLPVLSPTAAGNYCKLLGVSGNMEHGKEGLLPMWFANRFGWEELVKETAFVYSNLSYEEKKDTIILGASYGEAGAIDLFGKKYGLPNAISTHNNYFLWGGTEDKNHKILIAVGFSDMFDLLKTYYSEVNLEKNVYCKYAPAYRKNTYIIIAKSPRRNINEEWHKLKFYF